MEGQYCVDLLNNTVLPSKIYSPGPDPCTSCTCDNGAPTYCKVITCATPKNCRLVHPHTTCCNFECHENADGFSGLGSGSTVPERVLSFNELTLRFVVIAFTVFISMSLVAFLVHRLKTRKPRGRQPRPLGVEDNRIGYIEGSIRGSIRYLPEYVAYEPPHAALWKPHGYYPAGEAPPPYEEAVAAARAEAALQTHAMPADTPSLGIVSTVTMPYHRTIPLNLLSGNSHATTTTTTAVIVRSNVHYDTLPQASQTNAIENIRHPSLSRTSTTITSSSPSSLPSTLPSTQQSLGTCQTPSHLGLIKSPSYQPSPKTPSGSSKHKPSTGGSTGVKTSQGASTAGANNIYANVPSPVSNTTSFIGATGSSCKERTVYTSHDKYADKMDKSSVHDRSERHVKSPGSNYAKYEKCERGFEIKAGSKNDYVVVTKWAPEGSGKPECDRAASGKLEEKFHSEHAHHGHKKHKKMTHGTSTVQRNLTMPKASKNGKLTSGKNQHTTCLALEKQYDQLLKNSLKQTPSQPTPHAASHHTSRSSGAGARASVSTISSAYASHHSTIPNYFTSPSLPTPSDVTPPLNTNVIKPPLNSDVIKPPSIYKSSTTPTLLSHLSNSNPILSMSLDSNDEDFIDECENCRSDFPSGDLESRMMSDLETMTLQRARPNCYEEFSSASLTLPTHCRVQRPSPMNNGPPPVINRFSSILSQSSLSEEDD